MPNVNPCPFRTLFNAAVCWLCSMSSLAYVGTVECIWQILSS
uniref:Uncharacterized protein n=1 Tax=Anguilla anguilla TaxID=7936 RepID=A0A0E9S558_ANGAN